MATLNVVSICGSLRKGSYNAMVQRLLPSLAPDGMTVKPAPSFADFPLYNADIQNSSGFPAPVNTLADAIRAADGVIFCTPEYNFSIPAASRTRSTGCRGCRTSRSPASLWRCNRFRPDPSAGRACSTTCANR